MSSFAAVTKGAATLSAIAVAILEIGFHPDMTAGLRVLCTLAAVAGWLLAGARRPIMHGVWVAAAILAPATLRLLTGREGPILDLFWMAGLTASLLRTGSWMRWSLDDTSRLLAGGWALTLALAWPVLVARELAFDPRLIVDAGAINSWSQWSAPHVVSWIAFVVWMQLLGLLWLDWLVGRRDTPPGRAPSLLHPLWIATTLASLVAIYQGLVDLSLLNTGFWAESRRASATLLDANAYGICAALAGPSAIVALRGVGWPRSGPLITLVWAINLAGLWMSGSRVAALCGGVALVAVGIALWRQAGSAPRRVVAVAAGGAVLVALLVFGSGAVGPAGRLFDRNDDATGSFASIVLNRPPYGPMAQRIIRDYLPIGVGIGTYQHLAADYWRREADQALPFDHAQNWWRHQAAELGLLGALPLFLWSALIAWQVVLSRPNARARFASTIVRGLLLAIGLGSIIQIPTQTPVVLLWFMLLLAWLPALIDSPLPSFLRRPLPAAVAPLLAGLAIVYAAGHLALGRGPLAVAERARAFGREYVVGAYAAEASEAGAFRWTDDEARFIWPTPTRWFVIQMWAYHPDIDRDPVRVTLTTPCGPLAERVLTNRDYVRVGIAVPEGQKAIDVTVKVSRTWQPSSVGGADSRRLGVGIAADAVATPDRAPTGEALIDFPGCPGTL